MNKIIDIYQVDAFTDEAFKGNPAAVCILDNTIEDRKMQLIASEMNLSEIAFILPKERNTFQLRWFTPKEEVPLCGHATLAASEVLFNEIGIDNNEIIYETKSGILRANKDADGIILDFPRDEYKIYNNSDINYLLKAMGISDYKKIIYGKGTKKLVVHLENEKEVININPDFEVMKKFHLTNIKGVGVTAQTKGKYDFITRYFNPWAGVNEDSVTGSVHTLLATYWKDILDKKILRVYQASQRSGEILLRIKENKRVELVGKALIVLKGKFFID